MSLKLDFSTEQWLRLATWWIIKSRIVRRLLLQSGSQPRKTDTSLYRGGWERSISEQQAYADLRKASWIFEEILGSAGNEESFSYVSVRQVIKDLTMNLDKDFRKIRDIESAQPSVGHDMLLKQDLSLLESFQQEVEAKEGVPFAMDDPSSPHRWFNTDQDNAGTSQERVMFRTYVNAQLGDRELRSKSSNAPYMLLTWTAAHESDIMISLCNHRGTLNLSRKFLIEDLEKNEGADAKTIFQFDFPSQEAEIMFLSDEDVSEFFNQPRIFFAAMKKKAPKPGELAIFQAPLSAYADSYVQVNPKGRLPSRMDSRKTSSCGIRLYELTHDQCWKTTRRLVISPPPDSPDPACASFWLPRDHVRILLDGFHATVSWSDCGHLQAVPDSNYGGHHAFTYRAELPNRKVHLHFASETDARKFKATLLFPAEIPSQIAMKDDLAFDSHTVRLYRLVDADEPDHNRYHAIALTRRSPQGPQMTKLVYAYRDLDWIIATKHGRPCMIDLYGIYVPQYVSTLPRLQYKPTSADISPEFSHAVQDASHARTTRFELGCDHNVTRFMHKLIGWKLKFFRPVNKLVTIDTSYFICSPKETFKSVIVQIWEKESVEGPSRIQLAVRLDGRISDRWVTASITDNNYGIKSSTVEIDHLAIQRGVGIDTKGMTAKRPAKHPVDEQGLTKRKWKIAITFPSNTGKQCLIFRPHRSRLIDEYR